MADVMERVKSLVEELLDEELLTEMTEQDWAEFADDLSDSSREIERLAICVEEYIIEKMEEAEPQFDTLEEERGEK